MFAVQRVSLANLLQFILVLPFKNLKVSGMNFVKGKAFCKRKSILKMRGKGNPAELTKPTEKQIEYYYYRWTRYYICNRQRRCGDKITNRKIFFTHLPRKSN